MSRFERKLRQDMAELASQLAPGDLRPLRPPSLAELAGSPVRLGPSARSARRPGQWLGPMAAMLAVALVAGGLLAARNVLHAHAAAGMPAAERAPADPPVVAIAGMSASGRSAAIRITSVKAGRTVRSLPIASDGNGLALAPDAKSLYVVGPALRISQVSVVSGASKSLGAGAYPAVSPDSATLAYASGDDFSAVAVRSLRSDYVRSISLRPLIGAGSSLLNQGGLTWLGNGFQVVAVPEPDPVAISGGGLAVSSGSGPRTGSASGSVRPARRTACGQQNSPHGLCVIVVDVRPRALQARKVFVPYVVQAGPLDALSGDLTTASSFVMVQSTKGGDVVNEVTLGQPAVTVRRLVTLPFQALAVGIAPRADRVLYVPEKSPIGVWISVMSHGRLTRTRRLMSDVAGFEFAQAAW